MADNMPGYSPDALTWLEARIAGWVASPAAIGLTSAVVTSLATDITNARTDFTSVQAIRGESMAATVTFNASGKVMRTNGALAISTIKAFADAAPIPSQVYETANVSPADPRSPALPPEQPASLEAILQNNGSVEVSWSGKGPVGTLYEVYRKLATETTFTFLGNVDASTKKFNDAGVPAGTISAAYQVRAIRADLVSPYSTQFSILFGTNDGAAAAAAA